MRYLGGKSKTRKQIAGYLESIREGRQYLEPFVGGAWILQEMSGERYASDSNGALITMYKALQTGWVPPEDVSEELYREYKAKQNEDDPLTAFIGIGCSFGGKWFGGYAGRTERNYAVNAKNSLLKQLPLIQDVKFLHRDYRWFFPENTLVYCDPPYEGTTGYRSGFSHKVFWDTIREWSEKKHGNTVVVSEYKAPADFQCVLEIPIKTDMRMKDGSKDSRIEKLFTYKG